MELQGSSPHSQVPATCPYHQPVRSSPYPTTHFLKTHLNIIHPTTPGPPKLSLSLRFHHQNPVSPLLSPYALHAPSIPFLPILSPEKFWVRFVTNNNNNFDVTTH